MINELNTVNRTMEDNEFRFYNAKTDSMVLGYNTCEAAVLESLDTLKNSVPCEGCGGVQSGSGSFNGILQE